MLNGKIEELRSLGTKDAEEAKRRFSTALVEIDAKWAQLRGGPQSLTEREAHAPAATIHENWLEFHRDEPSNQLIRQTGLYRRLWTVSVANAGKQDGVGIDELSLQAMRRFCFQQADLWLSLHGLIVDRDGRTKLARAVGAALQRASLTLEREGQGVYDDEQLPHPPPRTTDGARRSRLPVGGDSTNNSGASTITGLLDDWWREAKAAGRKPSTYESYRNTVTGFVSFLKHDDARRLTAEDVSTFKDHRLATPSPRTGRVPSAKTVKDSDLSALKTVFGWALINRRLSANHAAGITIKVGKPSGCAPRASQIGRPRRS